MSTAPTNPLVTKSNHLIESAYKLSLAEQRLLLAVVAKIDSHPNKPPITAADQIEVSATEIADLFDMPVKQAYAALKDAAERLYERSVTIGKPDPDDPRVEYTKTRWVSAVSYLPAQGYVGLYLAPKVLPYLTQLAGEFTRYRLQNVAPMSSVYAIRLYELLVQWESTGEREVGLDWLRQQFLVPDNYSRLFDLKRYVIQPAIDQINAHSNLTVSYTQRKAGRQVVALQFKFGPKVEPPPLQATSVPASKPKLDRAFIEANARPGESWEQAAARLSARAAQKV